MIIHEKLQAIYKLGNMKLKGFVDCYCDDSTFWFNTKERDNEGLRPLMVSAEDVLVVIK